MQTGQASAPPLPALVDHSGLRFLIVFLLYLAQGVPTGMFFFAVPAWMAVNKASAADVGFVLAATTLPWSLKLINGVIMDRFAFPPMGRRRPWIIGAQSTIAVVLILIAIVDPAPSEIAVLAAFAFATNLAITFQDVGIDGLACDVIPESEQGRANGFMFGAQAIGIAAGASIGGGLMICHGIGTAALAQAIFVAVIITAILVVRERPGERLLPWHPGVASQETLNLQLGGFLPILKSLLAAMLRRDILIVSLGAFLGVVACGLFYGLGPLFAAQITGWKGDEFTEWSGHANLVGGLLGALVFGFVAERLGARRLLMIYCVLIIATAAAALVLQPVWANPRLLIGLIFVVNALQILNLVAWSALAMRLVSPAVAATQFSLFMACGNFGNSAASALLGPVDAIGGMRALFMVMGGAGLLSLAVLAFANRRIVGD